MSLFKDFDKVDRSFQDYMIHKNHCDKDDFVGSCKYGDDDCLIIEESKRKNKMSNTDKKFQIPAFPMQYADDSYQGGMDLRDYFASKALQGMLCNGFIPSRVKPEGSVLQAYNYAEVAYKLADEMLEARKA
jgi:hypothetical protein